MSSPRSCRHGGRPALETVVPTAASGTGRRFGSVRLFRAATSSFQDLSPDHARSTGVTVQDGMEATMAYQRALEVPMNCTTR